MDPTWLTWKTFSPHLVIGWCVCDDNHQEKLTLSLQGDAGAPLFCQKYGTYFLFGVVTWGSWHCDSEKPAIFTRVSDYQSWIRKMIFKFWLKINSLIKLTFTLHHTFSPDVPVLHLVGWSAMVPSFKLDFCFYYKSLQSVSIGLWKQIIDPCYKKDQKRFLWHVFVFLKNSRVFESESGFDFFFNADALDSGAAS